MGRILPVLFNTDMVKAVLEGRKTATRRICKDGSDYSVPDMGFYDAGKRTYAVHNYSDREHHSKLGIGERRCPVCPGDILYVRETWNFVYDTDDNDHIMEDTGRYLYYADDPMPFSHWADPDTGAHKDNMPWRPSIHMPKAAARIWLKVTDVRVERLQEIGMDDCVREGIDAGRAGLFTRFSMLWDSTIKKADMERYGWDANPWVWVIEFERCRKPE